MNNYSGPGIFMENFLNFSMIMKWGNLFIENADVIATEVSQCSFV